MQVTETNVDGLKREIKVTLGANELSDRCDKRLDELKDQVQLKGFRKGKVPKVHLKKMFGRRVMAEVLQEAVEESSRKALDERNERPASQPTIDLPQDESEIEGVMEGSNDLAYSMKYEIVPSIELVDFATLNIEKLVADVDPAAVDEAVADLAKRNVAYEAVEGRNATEGDKVKIDFVGKIDGEAFEGGTADDVDLVIGQGGFIPGFEEGITGAKAGEQKLVEVNFPDDYPVDTLKGKAATFDVTIKEVAEPKQPEIDDEFAKSLGTESLENLRELISAQIGREYEQVSRMKMKRKLLDLLDENHAFELPSSLVDTEFNQIWEQVTGEMEQAGKSFEDAGKTEEGAREEYRKIAERRVRLGLVLGEIGEKGQIEVTQEELREAMVQQARQYPGQERQVFEYFEKTPGAVGQLRAPIFEEKVVDHILDKANVSEKKVTKDELVAPLEGDEDETDNAPAADAS
jgi:trigger factor